MMRDFNDFNSIQIKIASPDMIREWSYGEVKKPETINYRTLRPEKDGLFCERIFGTTKEWECYCGKFKSIRYKGVVCDRCGVEVTHYKVRRERGGHIELACPVAHIWYYRSVPSRAGLLLNLTVNALKSILYYEKYVVIDPGNTELKHGEIIDEDTFNHYYETEGDTFIADMGASAIKEMLLRLDLDEESRNLRVEIADNESKVDRKLIKRLEIIESFRDSGNKPEWMVLDTIPVIPPELRPMVQLDGGRFATSDLNDLYRRVINRNNRLKRLLMLRAPDIIIRNEKRMLQEAVDALFDNSRRKRAVKGKANRPLKSLSDMLKGKQGRFRQNLLGKRVDYSGRSVIVVGPQLKLHQCGLPKKMALELFKPFVYSKLEDRGLASTIKSAKKMVEREDVVVWDILEEVVKEYPILLNRAPTLHRLGIQAFEPILVEGNAIQLHPLACPAFNADFDGDQMAVDVPLSTEAQAEAETLMLSSHNILSPANGTPIALPAQDIVLGCYYLTMKERGQKGEGKIFSCPEEAIRAQEEGYVHIHAKVKIRVKGNIEETTIGRVIFNQILPADMKFVDLTITKKSLAKIISYIFRHFGQDVAAKCLDDVKELGFHYATTYGITIGVVDLEIHSEKDKIIEEAEKNVSKIKEQYNYGLIMEEEREEKIITAWTDAANNVVSAILNNLRSVNPLFMMADSGARGSRRQIGQLAGMRGLMADPSGKIIEFPIRSNFREGLSSLEYFISTHGARKGLADTALRTSKSGYLTRRLIDVAQDVIITEKDCGTNDGVIVSDIKEDDNIIEKLEERVVGRTAQKDIIDTEKGVVIVQRGETIDEKIAKKVTDAGIKEVKIRSPLTCSSKQGICAKCYGKDVATGKKVTIGEAVGTIAAQSIGEPGTQLTLRTFHTGGIKITGEDITLGLPRIEQLFEVRKPKKQAVISEINGFIDQVKNEQQEIRKEVIVKPEIDESLGKNKENKKKTYFIPNDLRIIVEEGQKVNAGQRLTTGFVDPNDILRILGIKAVQKYLLEQVQEVYRSQGVTIDDKHIEVIVRQIARLNKIYVRSSRDSDLLSGELVYVSDFEKANKLVMRENEEIRNRNRELLLEKKLASPLYGNKKDIVVDENTIIDENTIKKIEHIDYQGFDMIEEHGRKNHIIQGEMNFIDRITGQLFIDGALSQNSAKIDNNNLE